MEQVICSKEVPIWSLKVALVGEKVSEKTMKLSS
jgi:hypothetical protein